MYWNCLGNRGKYYWKCREHFGELTADYIWWMKDVVLAIPLLIPTAIFAFFVVTAISIPIMVGVCFLRMLIGSL